MLLAVRLSSVTLNDLRARAAGGSRAPPPAAATLLRRHRASPGPRAGLAAAVAEVYRSPVAAARGSSSSDGAPSSLHRSVRKALDAKRPLIAAHLLAEEWALTCKSLDDPALSKEVILQLVHHVNTAAALAALPTVTATADTVAEAIGAAQQRGSLKGVRALLHHAQEQALSRGPEAREMWRAAIVALGALRRPAEARAAFVGMRSMGAWEVGDTATVNLLLNALAADVKLQFIRYNQLRQDGIVPDTSTFNCLLKGCMRARDVKRAGLALEWMAAAGVAADEITWNTLIKVFSYAGDFEGVLDVWRRMHAAAYTPTPKLWGSLLVACSAAGQLEQCHIFWWEMRTLHALHVQGGAGNPVLTTDATCAMMTACNDAGQYERALMAFQEARGLGVPLDTRAFNIALRACHSPGKTLRPEQLLQAFSLYDDLKRSSLRPDTFTFATLFTLCAAASQGHCALELHKEMQDLGVPENVVALTALAKAVGATPGPDMAQECTRILRRMARGPARMKPNQATFRTVIAALREQGELAEALQVYESMRRVYPADNSEFEGLTAMAAERALTSEDAELRSAVAAVCSITSCRQVDLHGASALEARAAVLCVLAMLQQQFKDAGRVLHDCVIITGQGRGSQGKEPVVRQEVLALLERLGLCQPPLAANANPGRIVLSQQMLCDVLRARAERRAAQESIDREGGSNGSPADGGGSGGGSEEGAR